MKKNTELLLCKIISSSEAKKGCESAGSRHFSACHRVISNRGDRGAEALAGWFPTVLSFQLWARRRMPHHRYQQVSGASSYVQQPYVNKRQEQGKGIPFPVYANMHAASIFSPQTLCFLRGGPAFFASCCPLRSSLLECGLRIIICISLKLNLLRGNVRQIKLEAAGVVMRTPASRPRWFERTGPPTARERDGRGLQETSGECVCALDQAAAEGLRPTYCFARRSVFRREDRSLCLSSHSARLSLSGTLEQQGGGGYVCDHAWALCCRSPRACCAPAARPGSHVVKYTLRENRRLYIKPNQPWSQELITTPRTRACLHEMASGPTRHPQLRVWRALVLEQSSQSLCWIGVVCWCLLGISCGLVCQYCRLGSTLIGSPSEWNMRNPRHAGLSLRELCGKHAVGLRRRGEERRDALVGKRLVSADVLESLRGQQVDDGRYKQTHWTFHSSGSFWFSLHLSNQLPHVDLWLFSENSPSLYSKR